MNKVCCSCYKKKVGKIKQGDKTINRIALLCFECATERITMMVDTDINNNTRENQTIGKLFDGLYR